MDSILSRLSWIALATLLTTAHAGAQSAASNGNANANAAAKSSASDHPPATTGGKSADDDWSALTSILTSNAPAATRATKSASQHATEHTQSVAHSQQVAKAAKDFYQQHPDDPRALQAKKTEALSLLRGADGSNPEQEKQAIGTAQAFRQNQGLPAKDRFEVAMAMDLRDRSKKLTARGARVDGAEEQKTVEKWRSEFGSLPEIDVYAVGAARRSDPANGNALAVRVARSAVAPAQVKAEAASLSRRVHLLGSAPSLKVTAQDGSEINLAQANGKVTLVIVWPASEADVLQNLARFAKAVRPNVQFIYVAVGGSAADAAKLQPMLPIPGKSAYAATEAAVSALQIHTMPYIYVLNRSGALSDFGPLDQAMAVFGRAGVISTKHL